MARVGKEIGRWEQQRPGTICVSGRCPLIDAEICLEYRVAKIYVWWYPEEEKGLAHMLWRLKNHQQCLSELTSEWRSWRAGICGCYLGSENESSSCLVKSCILVFRKESMPSLLGEDTFEDPGLCSALPLTPFSSISLSQDPWLSRFLTDSDHLSSFSFLPFPPVILASSSYSFLSRIYLFFFLN